VRESFGVTSLTPRPSTAELVTAASIATQRIVDALAEVDDGVMRRPSRLPGWTIGHVLSHIALNGEAFGRCAADLRAGRPGLMYPSVDQRTQDIDAAAQRSTVQIAAHLADSAAVFVASWDPPPPDGTCATAPGLPEFASHDVPLRRVREVEVHALDTGLPGFTAAKWSDAYVAADLPQQLALLPRRMDDATHRAVLAWLDRRTEPEIDLVPWGDASRWRS
jgi:maleylpyruvate isomerase